MTFYNGEQRRSITYQNVLNPFYSKQRAAQSHSELGFRSIVEMEKSSPVHSVTSRSREFIELAANRRADHLDGRLGAAAAAANENVPELALFVKILRKDYYAVRGALTYEWSNGQVEGQVNRLKMIKRQMYGRAGFQVLRQRVLAAR